DGGLGGSARVPARPDRRGGRAPPGAPGRRDRLLADLPGPVPAAARPLLRRAEADAAQERRARAAVPGRRARAAGRARAVAGAGDAARAGEVRVLRELREGRNRPPAGEALDRKSVV